MSTVFSYFSTFPTLPIRWQIQPSVKFLVLNFNIAHPHLSSLLGLLNCRCDPFENGCSGGSIHDQRVNDRVDFPLEFQKSGKTLEISSRLATFSNRIKQDSGYFQGTKRRYALFLSIKHYLVSCGSKTLQRLISNRNALLSALVVLHLHQFCLRGRTHISFEVLRAQGCLNQFAFFERSNIFHSLKTSCVYFFTICKKKSLKFSLLFPSFTFS